MDLKTVSTWGKNNPITLAVLFLIVSILIDVLGGVRMLIVIINVLYKILSTINPFYALEISFLILSVGFLVFAIIQRRRINKKRYTELLEQVKLSRSIKHSISVEESGKPTIQPGYGEFPLLNFDMRVINRTYLPLEPEEATIQCFCGSEQVCAAITWNKKVKTPDIETYISIDGLLKYDGGHISFQVPIGKIYDDLSEWKIRGSVKYELDRDVMQDLQPENGLEFKIDLKYKLSKDEQMKLRKKIENALANME